MIRSLLKWWNSREQPYWLFMPRELRKIQTRVERGEDPDDVAGIEKLWLWRFKKRSDAFAEDYRKFIAWETARRKAEAEASAVME